MNSFIFQDAKRTHFHQKVSKKSVKWNGMKWTTCQSSRVRHWNTKCIENWIGTTTWASINWNIVQFSFAITLSVHDLHVSFALNWYYNPHRNAKIESPFQIVNNYVSFRIIFPIILQPSNRKWWIFAALYCTFESGREGELVQNQ